METQDLEEKRELKLNVWTSPLPEEFGEGPLVFVTSWKIPKENHERMVDHVTGSVGNWGMDNQLVQPLKHLYTRTRHWFKDNGDGTEDWWFMDEYDSAEAFRAMQKSMQKSFKDLGEKQAARHRELLSLMVPGTVLKPTLYSEVVSARIEFEPYELRAAVIQRMEKAAQNQ
jgi:hypothetical protein